MSLHQEASKTHRLERGACTDCNALLVETQLCGVQTSMPKVLHYIRYQEYMPLRQIMVTALRQVTEPVGALQALRHASDTTSFPYGVFSELLALAQSVLDNTHNMRSLQREIDRAVPAYFPLKLSIIEEVTQVTGEKDVENLQQLINQEILNALGSSQQ